MTNTLENYKFNPQFIENETLRQRLEYLEGLVMAGEHFESTRSLLDLKSLLKDAYGKFNDLLDELYKSKQGYEYEKLKCQFLEKKLTAQPQIQEETPIEDEQKLKKVKELEEKIGELMIEMESQKAKTEKYQKMINKKDFFREYDYMCKEVEGLRKQNYNLTELIKRMQEKENPAENEEDPSNYN